MKKLLAIIVLTFMISGALVGCVPSGSQENNKDNGITGGESTDGKGDSGDNNTENGGNSSTDGGESTESGGNSSTEGGENTENGGNSSTGGGESTENGGNSFTGGGENTENGGNSSTGGGENTENGGNSSTGGGESTENGGNSSTGGGENTENGGNNEEKEENTPTPTVGTEVGNLFASITLERLDGGTVSPDDYRGKIVILNIWATRCPPCKAELPDFNRIASEYADEVVIIAAHDYYGKAGAPDYVAENFPDTKIIFAYDTIYSDAYNAAGGDGYIPFTAILDQSGVIVYSDSGMLSYDQLDKMLGDLLSE